MASSPHGLSAYDGVLHTALRHFAMVDTSTAGIELSEDASFGIGTLLVVEQLSLEKRPRGV